MSEGVDSSQLERSRVMNNEELYFIVSYLTLEEKLKLSSVSKRFFECVDQQLRCEKSLLIRVECKCYTRVRLQIIGFIRVHK
jgi:hypothetical protein